MFNSKGISSSKGIFNRGVFAIFAITCTIVFLALSACQQLEAATAEDVQIAQAVSDGLIISPDELEAAGLAFTTAEVFHGRLSRHSNVSVSLHFPVSVDLFFERSGGRLSYRNATERQFVEAGDVLFSVVFDVEALQVEEQQLLLRMAEAERRHNSDMLRRRSDIEAMRNRLNPGMDEFDLEIHTLRLEGFEAEYQNAIHQFRLQSREQQRQLHDIRERIEGEDIIAPFDGFIAWANVIRMNTAMDNRVHMVTLYDYNTFQFSGWAARDVFRYGDIVMVSDRNGIPRETKVVSDPLADSVGRSETFEFILQAIDNNLEAQDFAQEYLSANPLAVDVEGVIVPTRAVQAADGRRFVYVYEDGIIRKRYVQVGMVYGHESQILDGIRAGQHVVLH